MPNGAFWLFTENSNADEFRTNLEKLYETTDNLTYICGQLEEGTHKHFQGYLQLKISKPESWMKNNISKTAHFEIQYKNASSDRGRHYASKPHTPCIYDCDECKKEIEKPTAIPDTFVEYGEIREKGKGEGQGKRNDIIQLREAAKDYNRTERSIQDDDDLVVTYASHLKFFDRVRMMRRPPHLERVSVRLYVGESGAGKTSKAYSIDEDYYEVPIENGSSKWYDGYDQNKVLIFDDFAGRVDHTTLVTTLKLFDRYVRRVPIKGSHTWLRSPIVIVTSNYHPRAWYDWTSREKSYKAIMRRFTQVVVFEEPREDEFEEVEFNTRREIKDYFYDKDLWPVTYEYNQ